MQIKDTYTFKQFKERCPAIIDNFYYEKLQGNRSEDDELIDLVSWFKANYPHHALSIAHPVNENSGAGQHSKGSSINHLKRQQQKGKLKGLHDVLIFIPAGPYGFMTLELKRSNHKSSVEENQINVAMRNIANKGYSCFAWGLKPAKEAIKSYMELRGE